MGISPETLWYFLVKRSIHVPRPYKNTPIKNNKKRCSRCKKHLPFNDFYVDRYSGSPRRHNCKKCCKFYCKKFEKKSKLNPVYVSSPQRWYLRRIERGAIKRNLSFRIKLKDIEEIYTGKCALSGREILLTRTAAQSYGNQTSSLDRIDSSKGYIKGNIQWLHKDVQKMKNNLSQKRFDQICKARVKKLSTLDNPS